MSTSPGPAFALQLSGRPAVCVAGGAPAELQPMDAALLAWLALQGPTPRGRLAELLWPASAADAARGALRQRLYKLRHALGAELVVGSTTLALADGTVHDLDGERGLLEGLALPVGGEFDQWLAHERQRRRLARRRRHVEGIDAAEAAGDVAGALDLALAWLDAEPELEDAHRRVIRLHYGLGDRGAALAAYQRCVRMLERAHGSEPDAETRALRDLIDGLTPTPTPASRAAGPAGSAGSPGRPPAGGAPPVRTAPRALPAALLRPPRLVGREAEAAAALAAWAEGKVIALVAEAGMGKTRLLHHLLPPGGDRAVYVAARPGDAGVPLATLARLVRALLPAAEAPGAGQTPGARHGLAIAAIAPAARRALESVLPEAVADPAGAAGAAGTAVALRAAGVAAPAPAGDRPALLAAMHALLDARPDLAAVAIDDLHFADGASLRLLQSLLEDSPAADAAHRPRWALGYRPAEADGTLHDLHDALTESMRVHALALPPLSAAALAELVDSLALPGLVGAEWAEWLLRRTGGNPMFVLETLKQHALAGGLGGEGVALDRAPSPVSVRRLIERRLAQLSPAALALARCAAVAGTDFDLTLASAVLETPALALADAWAELEAAGVLRDQAFAHDLVHETALASLPGPVARHLHGDIAARLEAAGRAPPGTLARHWLAAGQPERALPNLERAAQAAAQAYDAAGSARLWLQLADLHEAAERTAQAFEAAMAAANALRSHTHGASADVAIDRMEALARSPNERAAVFKQRAELALARGDVESAAAHTQAGLAALPADAPPGQRAALLNSLGIQLRRIGHLVQARSALEEALTLLRTSGAGNADELPSVLNNLGLVLQEMDDHVGAIPLMQEAAERQPDPMTRARVLNNIGISLEERGQVQLAYDQRLAAARAVAGSSSVVELNLAISLGASARNLCRFRDAIAHLERAREVGHGQRFQREQDLHRQFAAIWIALGRFNLAREAIDRAEATAAGDTVIAVIHLVRGRLLAVLRQREAAAALLRRAREVLEPGGDVRSLRRVWVAEAMVQEPEAALERMEMALVLPTIAGNAGAALPLVVRKAQALDALGRPAEALREAQRAADWLQAVQPLDMSPAEVWMTLARAAERAGERALATQAAAAGLAFVERIATDHVDEMYRDGWRRQNPVNAELATIAARLGRG